VLLSIDNEDDGTSADETAIVGLDDNEIDTADEIGDDDAGTAGLKGPVGAAALVLAFVGPRVNGAAVLGVTEPLKLVKPELMDSEGPVARGPVVREFEPGVLVDPLPREPLEPVPNTEEVVLVDPSPLGEGIPGVKVDRPEDKVAGLIVLFP
jgi:hypothetical protein